MYDGVLLNRILASIPLTGLEVPSTNKGIYDLRKIADQIAVSQEELAFGKGAEGTVREIFTPKRLKNEPFSSWTARFENPGEIWVEIAEHLFEGIPLEAVDKITAFGLEPLEGAIVNIEDDLPFESVHTLTAYGLVPLEEALAKIEEERIQKQLSPDKPTQFEVKGIRILPSVMVEYTNALQQASRESAQRGQSLDVESFRVNYFKLDSANPEVLPKIFSRIKQDYLGNTTWATLLKLQLSLRIFDYFKGLLPFGAGSILDFMQAYTGKELPFPGVERLVMHKLKEANTPISSGMLEKPTKSRWIEIADALLGLAPLLLPPAYFAKVPFDAIVEGLLYLDQMYYASNRFLPSLKTIADDTGTTPKIITKAEELKKAAPGFVSDVWGRIKTLKPPKDILKRRK
jgi:hypothetical protein